MLWQSNLNFDGSTRSVNDFGTGYWETEHGICVDFDFNLCFVSNVFASSTPKFAKKSVKCFNVFQIQLFLF